MKNYIYTASILQNSRKIVSNSNSDWSKLTPGYYIKFPFDDIFYTVAHNEKIFLIKEFEALDPRRIKIKGNSGIKISKGDLLKISYKEYELSTISEIVNAGQNYKIDDILEVCGGSPVIDTVTNLPFKTKICVKDVDSSGQITQIGLVDRGKYNIINNGNFELKSETGFGAILNLSFNQIDNTIVVERQIHLINCSENSSIIVLDYALPPGIKKGNITIEKWEATLKEEYVGETKINEPYELFGDFTPNYRFPLPVKGSLSTETILRESLTLIDRKIQELECTIKKINQLGRIE